MLRFRIFGVYEDGRAQRRHHELQDLLAFVMLNIVKHLSERSFTAFRTTPFKVLNHSTIFFYPMSTPPSPEKLREEITEFLRSKYGNSVALTDVDVAMPKDGFDAHDKKSVDEIDFDLKPIELEEYLRNYVLHQESAVEILATKICTHFHRRRYELEHPEHGPSVGRIKSNILMIGPTGVGKTYLVKLIADKIGVPFVKGDATKFSETGYVGGDVDDLVRDLVREAKGDIQLAQYGIVYVDEIDKIAASGNSVGPDVSRGGVQRALLKLMEDTDVDLRTPHDLASQMEAVMEAQKNGKSERKKVSTKNILFIVSGAFGGLPDIIRRRLSKGTMGFVADASSAQTKGSNPLPKNGAAPSESTEFRWSDNEEAFARISTQDLIEYGFESEFIGRLPVIAQLRELSENALYDVLRNPHSTVVRGKKQDFAAYGIELDFEDLALREIARRAFQQGIGARGLTSVVEKSLIRFEKILPSSSVRKLTVTLDMVLNPEAALQRILIEDAITLFQRKFLERTSLILEIPPETRQHIRENLADDVLGLNEKLTHMFENFEHGMKLAGLQSLKITPEVLDSPDHYLDTMIKKVYEKKGKKKDAE